MFILCSALYDGKTVRYDSEVVSEKRKLFDHQLKAMCEEIRVTQRISELNQCVVEANKTLTAKCDENRQLKSNTDTVKQQMINLQKQIAEGEARIHELQEASRSSGWGNFLSIIAGAAAAVLFKRPGL